MSPPRRRALQPGSTIAERVLGFEPTLLDVVDNVLTKGVVLSGDLMISLAHVDLIYARLAVLLTGAARVVPGEDRDPVVRHAARRRMRRRSRSRGG